MARALVCRRRQASCLSNFGPKRNPFAKGRQAKKMSAMMHIGEKRILSPGGEEKVQPISGLSSQRAGVRKNASHLTVRLARV